MTTSAPIVPVVDRRTPVLLGDRLGRLRQDLSGGFVTLVLLLCLGLVFLVAGLRPTTVTFADAGETYRAECGIETVLLGSTWDALDDACAASGGLRALATAGGVVLLLAGLGQVAWLAARRAGHTGPLSELLAAPRSRIAALGAALAALVAGAASLVVRARLDAAALSGTCQAGDCPDRAGLAGAVRLGALVALVVLVVVAAWPILRRRSRLWQVGAAAVLAGILLLLLAVRPATVTAGEDLRGTCGVEVLVAGHPQQSVTAACRDAMAGRPVAGIAGLAALITGAVLVRRAGAAPGDAGPTAGPVALSPVAAPRPRRRTRPLVAGEVER